MSLRKSQGCGSQWGWARKKETMVHGVLGLAPLGIPRNWVHSQRRTQAPVVEKKISSYLCTEIVKNKNQTILFFRACLGNLLKEFDAQDRIQISLPVLQYLTCLGRLKHIRDSSLGSRVRQTCPCHYLLAKWFPLNYFWSQVDRTYLTELLSEQQEVMATKELRMMSSAWLSAVGSHCCCWDCPSAVINFELLLWCREWKHTLSPSLSPSLSLSSSLSPPPLPSYLPALWNS